MRGITNCEHAASIATNWRGNLTKKKREEVSQPHQRIRSQTTKPPKPNPLKNCAQVRP